MAAGPRISTAMQTNARTSMRALLARVRAFAADWKGEQSRRIRISVDQEPPNVFNWLRPHAGRTRIYWSSRDERETVAAIGVADRHMAASSASGLRAALTPVLDTCAPGVRLYGGMRFDRAEARDARWKPFGAFQFVLPRFEVRCTPEGSSIACNLVMPRDLSFAECAVDELENVCNGETAYTRGIPRPFSRYDDPDEGRWNESILWALDAFSRTALDKVVFARKAVYEFMDALEPVSVLESLTSGTMDSFHYCFQPAGGAAFVGASPERLFKLDGAVLESEAVAGTRPRGEPGEEDERQAEALQNSRKDRLEHDYVRVSIREQLEPISSGFQMERQPALMKLASTLHLQSRARAILQPGRTSLDALEALHPTPAVGGYPVQAAMEAIREREPFDRGWYAGPVGWISRDASEFAVAIRSGLVCRNSLALYSGAGIVYGSTPYAEWREIEHKIGTFMRVIGLGKRRGVPVSRP